MHRNILRAYTLIPPELGIATIDDCRYLKAELSDIVGLPVDEIHTLILAGIFPGAECHPVYGPSWSRKKVTDWVDELSGSIGLAECLELVLGYRSSAWSRSDG